MKDNTRLHWSFDYNTGAQHPQFSHELIGTLRSANSHDTADTGTPSRQHVYTILPNYWRGYQRGSDTLRIGTATVERHKAGNRWHYGITYNNSTSGETRRMRFRCRDDAFRSLTDRWHLEATNSAGDRYTHLKSEGHLTPEAEVRLRINGRTISGGRVARATALTCNWALLDVIPAQADTLRASGEAARLAVLEDLSQLRTESRLRFFDSIETPLPLVGYTLHGVGLLPSYWWLDQHRNVAIISTFFETLVLRERSGGSV